MSAGTAVDQNPSHRSVTWTDPLRLFRTRLSLEPYDAPRHPDPFSEEALPPATRTAACDISETDQEIDARVELPGARWGETRAGERMCEAESGRGQDHRVEHETVASSRAAKPFPTPLTRATGCPT